MLRYCHLAVSCSGKYNNGHVIQVAFDTQIHCFLLIHHIGSVQMINTVSSVSFVSGLLDLNVFCPECFAWFGSW